MHRTYFTVFTPEMWPTLIPPLASYCPLFFLITPFYLLGEPAFLARGANTHPLVSLVCYQLLTLCYFTHPNTPHRSGYKIYIDDIINISRPVWYNYHRTKKKKVNWKKGKWIPGGGGRGWNIERRWEPMCEYRNSGSLYEWSLNAFLSLEFYVICSTRANIPHKKVVYFGSDPFL